MATNSRRQVDVDIEKAEWKVSDRKVYAMLNDCPYLIGMMLNKDVAETTAVYHNRIVKLRAKSSK